MGHKLIFAMKIFEGADVAVLVENCSGEYKGNDFEINLEFIIIQDLLCI
jgi:hypothetical protein